MIRKKIIAFTILIVLGMCLFPPWNRTEYISNHRYPQTVKQQPLPSEYAFIISPPESNSDEDDIIHAKIDIGRLAVQCMIVLIIGGGLIFFCPKERIDWNIILYKITNI